MPDAKFVLKNQDSPFSLYHADGRSSGITHAAFSVDVQDGLRITVPLRILGSPFVANAAERAISPTAADHTLVQPTERPRSFRLPDALWRGATRFRRPLKSHRYGL
jgi:hypothetical protein